MLTKDELLSAVPEEIIGNPWVQNVIETLRGMGGEAAIWMQSEYAEHNCDYCQLKAELAEAKVEAARLREDAARFNWWFSRSPEQLSQFWSAKEDGTLSSPDEARKTIDAARAQGSERG
jgi:hypothetical protein